MSRNLPSLFVEESNKVEQSQLLKLVTLVVKGLQDPLYICDNNFNIIFNGIEYTRFPVKINDISINSDGTIEKPTILVSNVNREIEALIENQAYNALKGTRVKIKSIYAKFLDFIYNIAEDGSISTSVNPSADPTAFVEDEFLIDSYSSNEQTITFVLEPVIDFTVKVPRRRYITDICYWRYKSDECGYSGALSTCKKTLEDCKAHANQARFGGAPGVPSSVRRVYF